MTPAAETSQRSQMMPTSLRAIDHYRREASINQAQADLDQSRGTHTTAAHHQRLADLWTALADELEAFGAIQGDHPDQGALL